MPPPKGIHGRLEAAIDTAISRYLDDRARSLGWDPTQGLEARDRLVGMDAVGEFGVQFSLPDDPLQTRGAGVVFVPPEQYASVACDRREYFPAVPHLVVEIISGSEKAADVVEKVQDYLDGGARRVWCIYPDLRRALIYDADGLMRVVREDGELTDDELLPGFALSLTYLFKVD